MFHGMVKYTKNCNGDHVSEGWGANIIAIPNRPGTKGRRVFNQVTEDNPIHAIIYDKDSGGVVGVFESTGPCENKPNTGTFANENNPDLDWPLQIKGMSLIDTNKVIARTRLEGMINTKVVKGSFQQITPEVYNQIKQHFSR